MSKLERYILRWSHGKCFNFESIGSIKIEIYHSLYNFNVTIRYFGEFSEILTESSFVLCLDNFCLSVSLSKKDFEKIIKNHCKEMRKVFAYAPYEMKMLENKKFVNFLYKTVYDFSRQYATEIVYEFGV